MIAVATPEAYRLLQEGSLVLSRMEHNGIRVDTDYLDRTIREVSAKVRKLEQELRADPVFAAWRKACGDRTKLGSREQLAKVIFDVLRLADPPNLTEKSQEEGAKQRYRTDDDVLRKVDCDFIPKYLEWDNLHKKVLRTYLQGIRREVVDGYLHPVFNLHTVATYRSSADSPNFQNIPIRDPAVGKLIRWCFVPRPGHHLVECDFKGIEVGVSCCYHQDPVLIDYVKDKTQDMHRDMAAQIYQLDPQEVNKDIRYCGKNGFVFPSFYGSYFRQIAPRMWEMIAEKKLTRPDGTGLRKHLRARGIKRLGDCDPDREPAEGTFERHLQQVEADFWGRRFRVYAEWKRSWYENYLREGSFQTLTGFRVVWGKGGLLSRNDAVNYPIQGSAFHCLLWTVIRLQKWLRKHKMRTRLIGQIHDSVLADVPPRELQNYLGKVREVVTADLPRHWDWICVPLEIEAEVSDPDTSWFDKHAWECRNGTWSQAK